MVLRRNHNFFNRQVSVTQRDFDIRKHKAVFGAKIYGGILLFFKDKPIFLLLCKSPVLKKHGIHIRRSLEFPARFHIIAVLRVPASRFQHFIQRHAKKIRQITADVLSDKLFLLLCVINYKSMIRNLRHLLYPCNDFIAPKSYIVSGLIPKLRPHRDAVLTLRKGKHEIFPVLFPLGIDCIPKKHLFPFRIFNILPAHLIDNPINMGKFIGVIQEITLCGPETIMVYNAVDSIAFRIMIQYTSFFDLL